MSAGPEWLVVGVDGLTDIVSPCGHIRLSVNLTGASWKTRETWERLEWEAAHRIAERLNRTEGDER